MKFKSSYPCTYISFTLWRYAQITINVDVYISILKTTKLWYYYIYKDWIFKYTYKINYLFFSLESSNKFLPNIDYLICWKQKSSIF